MLRHTIFQKWTFHCACAHVLAGCRPFNIKLPPQDDSWSPLYSLGKDRTENTAPLFRVIVKQMTLSLSFSVFVRLVNV
jgi:hypothetical protein